MKTSATITRQWVLCAFFATARLASAAVVDFRGDACGGAAQSPGDFTVRATATGLAGAQLPFGAVGLDFDVSGYAEPLVAPLGDESLTVLPAFAEHTLPDRTDWPSTLPLFTDREPTMDDSPVDGNHRYNYSIISFNEFAPESDVQDLLDIRFDVPDGVRGTVVIAPVGAPQTNIDDEPLGAGKACVVAIVSDPLPPTAEAGPDRDVLVGGAVLLDGSGSRDRAGAKNLAYLWEIVEGPGDLEGETTPTPTYQAPEAVEGDAIVRVRLTVTDPDLGPEATDEAAIRVKDRPKLPPEADAGPDPIVAAGAKATLDASGSRDNAGAENLAYEWELVAGFGSLSCASSATATYYAPASLPADSVAVALLTVTDPDTGWSDHDAAVLTLRSNAEVQCRDADGDGYFVEVARHVGDTATDACGPIDCDDDDPAVHPLNREWNPYDGVDENCNGLQACGTLAGSGESPLGAAVAYAALLLIPAFLRRLPGPLGRRR